MASATSTLDSSVSESPKVERSNIHVDELDYGEIHTKPAFINYVAAIFA